MVEAVLLPFNGKIIYDSIFSRYPVTFGAGIKRRFNDSYQEAKSRFGIITSLPFELREREESDADKLKSYLSSARNRERYSEEIDELIAKNRELLNGCVRSV